MIGATWSSSAAVTAEYPKWAGLLGVPLEEMTTGCPPLPEMMIRGLAGHSSHGSRSAEMRRHLSGQLREGPVVSARSKEASWLFPQVTGRQMGKRRPVIRLLDN